MKTWYKTAVAATVLSLLGGYAQAADEVNLYSSRKENLIKPLLDKFTAETGVTVNLVTGKASALMKRLQSEGANTPADILLTTDAGNLHAAKKAGMLKAIDSKVLESNVPAHLQDADNQWFGLSARSRIVVYSKDRVKADAVTTYEDLADPKWKGKICVRSSNNIYNQSLLASMIAHHGAEKAEAWAKGVVANMARKPQGNDRAQVKAVAAGECDIAIVNTYYLGKMVSSKKNDGQKEAAAKVAIAFPNQADRGAHVNVSGAGVVASSKNTDNAVKLIEYLSGQEAQAWYAKVNHEYPVLKDTPVSDIVAAWGYPFKQDALNISELGKNNAEAIKVFDRAGWK